MKFPKAFLYAVLLANAILCTTCVRCTLESCDGGFEIVIESSDGSPLKPGEYFISATLDGVTSEVTCSADFAPENLFCEFEFDDEENKLIVYPVMSITNGEDSDSVSHQFSSMRITYFFYDDSKIQGDLYKSTVKGPAEVSISIEHDGILIGGGEYSPSYDRDREFWGDENKGT